MKYLALDCETELIEAGNVAPRLACLTLMEQGKDVRIFGAKSAADVLKSYFDDHTIFIGHNIAFDWGVMCSHDESLIPHVFRSYRDGLVRETQIRETLILIREGRAIDDKNPHLNELAEKYLGTSLDKGEDSARYWFGDLINKPLDHWPQASKDYACSDTRATLNVFFAQQAAPGNLGAEDENGIPYESCISPDEILQTQTAWVLHLMRMWGFRTDAEMVARLKADLEKQCRTAEKHLLEVGIYRDDRTAKAIRENHPLVIAKNTSEVQRRVADYFLKSGDMPALTEGAVKYQEANPDTDFRAELARVVEAATAIRNDPGSAGKPLGELLEKNEKAVLKLVSCERDILETTDDKELHDLAEIGPAQKALGTFIPLIEQGAKLPVIVRWNALVRSGRTSCGDSGNDEVGNWQNPAKRPGIRESVKARDGYVYVSWDYSLAELCSLAQTCYEWFGASDMRDAIISGRDLHLVLACNSKALLGDLMNYDEAIRIKNDPDDPQYDLVDKRRQTAKNTNFGFPGGMGPPKFVHNCWQTSRVRVPLDEAVELKRDWLNTWREMRAFFDRIAREDDAGTPFVQPWSGRIRGFQRGDFCARANSAFQGRTADGAKLGGWHLAWDCYMEKESPLYGARSILFVHDQWVVECPEDQAHEAALRGQKILKKSMEVVTPDVPATLDFAVMRRWYKKAKAVFKDGKLVPWEPRCVAQIGPKKCGVQVGPLDKLCDEHKKAKAA